MWCKKILALCLVLVMCIPAFSGMNVSAEKLNKEEATAMMGLPDLENWHYKIPIIVDIGDYNRTDCILSQTINMTREVGGFGTFDENSVRVIETTEDDTSLYEVISQYRWVNNDILDVTWLMNDTTLSNTQRYYSIYFDILENGAKNATAYPEYLTIEENENEEEVVDEDNEEECKKNIWIVSENYEIKINMDRGGSRVVKINNAARKGFVYDNTWQSWHSDSLNWKIKGASTEIVHDGPIYKAVKVVSKDGTPTLYWYFYPDKMKIMFHGEGDISFDTIADNALNIGGTLVWSDEITENLTKEDDDNDCGNEKGYEEYSRVTDFFYILDPEISKQNDDEDEDDVKKLSGFWADTVDGRNQTIINAGEKGTRWILDGNSAWFGFAKNDVIRDVVLRSQNPPEITREYSWIILESPIIEDEKVFENQVIIIKGDLTVADSGTLLSIDSSLIVHGNITIEEGGELYIVSSREFLPSKPPVLPPLPPRPPRPPIRPSTRSVTIAGNLFVNGKLFIAKDSLNICSENDGMNGINISSTSSFECYNSTVTAFSGEIPVSITNQKIGYEKFYYNFDIRGEAEIDSSKISYLYDGIRLLNSSDVSIQNCHISDSLEDGIFIENCTPIIKDNTITNCDNAGIFIDSTSDKEKFKNMNEEKNPIRSNPVNVAKTDDIWEVKAEMDTLPENEGWTLVQAGGSSSVSSGILTIHSTTEGPRYYYKEWGADNSIGTTAEFRTRMLSGNAGTDLQSRQGKRVYVELYDNNKVGIADADGISYFDVSTDVFRVYRIIIKGNEYSFFIDNVLMKSGTPGDAPPSFSNVILFGETYGMGESISEFDYVYYTTKGAFAPGVTKLLTAKVDTSQKTGEVNKDVDFDGEGIVPVGRSITLYEWDFDGDGIYEYSSSTSASTTHKYITPGTYFPVLRVTDNMGATDTDYLRVNVWDPDIWSISGETITDCYVGIYIEPQYYTVAGEIFEYEYEGYPNIVDCIIYDVYYGIYCYKSYPAIVNTHVYQCEYNSIFLRGATIISVNAAYDRTTAYSSSLANTEGDSWLDWKELYKYGFNPYVDDSDKENALADFDDDGFTNVDEGDVYGTDTLNTDTDGDWVNDDQEINVDLTNPFNPYDNLLDSDDDILNDYTEVYMYGTDPLDPDTDDDDLTDKEEIDYEFDPLFCDKDPDEDGIFNDVEKQMGWLDPTSPEILIRIDWLSGYAPYENSIDMVKSVFSGRGYTIWTWSDADSVIEDYGTDLSDEEATLIYNAFFENHPDAKNVWHHVTYCKNFENSDARGWGYQPGDQFAVARKACDDAVWFNWELDDSLAHTTMHELGHNLGLDHYDDWLGPDSSMNSAWNKATVVDYTGNEWGDIKYGYTDEIGLWRSFYWGGADRLWLGTYQDYLDHRHGNI